MTVTVEHQARAEVRAAGQLGLLAENHLEVFQGRSIGRQLAAPNRRTRGAVALLGVGQVDQTVLGEIGRQHHIEQTTLIDGKDLRHATQWLGQLAFSADPTQSAGTFGHQITLAIWKKGHRPGIGQAFGDGMDL